MHKFCEDISSMFGVPMDANQEQTVPCTIKGLKKNYKRLAAVYSVKSEGALDGSFHLIFDREGMFTLAGLIVTQPEARIKENRTSGTASEAKDLSDAISEVGNLLIGSWDRMFQEGMDGHGHFVQSGTYIGNACGESEEAIGLSHNGEFLFSPFQMTVDAYPAFHCGVIFPRNIFGADAQADSETAEQNQTNDSAEQDDQTVQNQAESRATQQPMVETPVATDHQQPVAREEPAGPDQAETPVRADEEAANELDSTDEPQSGHAEKPSEEIAPVETHQTPQVEDETEVIEDPDETDEQDQESLPPEGVSSKGQEADESAKDDSTTEPQSPENESPDGSGDDSVPQTSRPAETTGAGAKQVNDIDESAATAGTQGLISETIRKMAESPAILPGEHSPPSLHMQAIDVMCAEIAWGGADDTVEQALTKMQQYDAGYMLVGRDGKIEGIVSRSDLAGAISPYLKPTFAKWRRPLDDATLQLKIKWIMTRPVRTVKPETTIATIMEQMCRSGGRCLPVIDKQGQALGLVTVFDIFKMMLEQDSKNSITGRTPQAPPLI